MTTFIWDLDGTLIDSYGVFIKGLAATFNDYGWKFDPIAAREYILKYSTNQFLREQPVSFEKIRDKFSGYAAQWNAEIRLMTGAQEILDWTVQQGIGNFLITHKSDNTFILLEQLGIDNYFKEIITSDSGFARKPDSESADYLIKKYDLNRRSCYYLGDRPLDIEFALNSGIKSINFLTAENSIKLSKLQDIMEMNL